MSPNVILLGIVSMLNDLSSEMIMPILPMFIQSLGGGSLAIGVLGGIRDSLSSLLNIVSGYMASRTGRKKIFVFIGYFTSALFKLLLALSNTLGLAMLVSSLERLGKGLRNAPRDAIIAESMSEDKGRAFGLHRFFDTTGAIFGSVFVLVLLWIFKLSFKNILIVASGLSFICLIPIAFVKEKRTAAQQQVSSSSSSAIPSGLKIFLFIAALFALGNFSYMFFVARAKGIFESEKLGNWAYILPVLLYVFFNIFYAGFALPLGSLADKIGKRNVIILGYLFFAITCFGFIFVTSTIGLAVLFAIYGISLASVDGNQRALVSDLAGTIAKSEALGLYHTFIGLAALPAGLFAGLLWKYLAPSATFVFGSALGLSCAAILFLFRRCLDQKQYTPDILPR